MTNCIRCGAAEEAHYDGSQCPVGNGADSGTQTFDGSRPGLPSADDLDRVAEEQRVAQLTSTEVRA